ncbi:MAG: GntR family transcriptional regulator [Eubacteriaceae bacterium]
MGLFRHQLDKNTPVPLYFQLKNILEDYIKTEHTNYEEPIPTEMEISEAFGVSRPTVRQAINALVVEGLLYRLKSKGTFVNRPKIHQNFLMNIESFNEEMKKKGLIPSTTVLDFSEEIADKSTALALQIPENSKILILERCRKADDVSIVHVTTYMPWEKCKSLLSQDFSIESLYHLLENTLGYKIQYATRQLEAIIASPVIAKTLDVPKGSPIQYIETLTYLNDDSPIEYSKAYYRGDRSQFTFKLIR